MHGGEKRNPKSNRVSILSRPRLCQGRAERLGRDSAGQIAESTVKYYGSVMRVHVPQWLKSKRLCDVTAYDMQRVLNAIDLSAGSKQRIRTAFMSFFTWCVDNGYLAKSPMKGTRLPRADTVEMRMNPFTWPQLEAFAGRIAQQYDPLMADVDSGAGYTGLRWGEIRVLKVRMCS